MSLETILTLLIGAVIGYYVVGHYLVTGKPA